MEKDINSVVTHTKRSQFQLFTFGMPVELRGFEAINLKFTF